MSKQSKPEKTPPPGTVFYATARTPGNYQAYDVWEAVWDGKETKYRLVREAEIHIDAVRVEQRMRVNNRILEIEGKR